MLKRKYGFTLIELLVVIAIIGILAVLVVTRLGASQIKARNSVAKSDITALGKAIETAKVSNTSGSIPRSGNHPDNSVDITAANVRGVTYLGTVATVLLGSNAYGGWTDVFNPQGTDSAKVEVNKTPANDYVYVYVTYPTMTSGLTAPAEPYGTNIATDYCIGTTINTGGGSNEAAFFVGNGTSLRSTAANGSLGVRRSVGAPPSSAFPYRCY